MQRKARRQNEQGLKPPSGAVLAAVSTDGGFDFWGFNMARMARSESQIKLDVRAEITKAIGTSRNSLGVISSEWTSIDKIESVVRRRAIYGLAIRLGIGARREIGLMVFEGLLEQDQEGDLVRIAGGIAK